MASPAQAQARDVPGAAIGAEPAALRQRFAAAFVPRPAIYWVDLLGCALIGWTSFVLSGVLPAPLSALAFALAVLALYRGVLFIHELAHLRPGAVPGFEPAWNLLVGIPLLAPSLMYVGSHAEHHRRSTYGTTDDPEYEPLAHWPPWRILASSLVMGVLPAALVLRWGVLGPLSRLAPPLRTLVVERLSTLVINAAYRRRPRPDQARRWFAGELGAAGLTWLAAGAFASGALGLGWLARWYGVVVGILLLNHVRTLAAHRYEHRGEALDVRGQLLDSVNLRGLPILMSLLAPVGLRFHGLHHLLPALPYHSLGAVHRRLLVELPADSAYRSAEVEGLGAALGSLLARAAENARRRRR